MYREYKRRLSVVNFSNSNNTTLRSMERLSGQSYPTAKSSKVYIPNTVVVPSDAVVDEEKVVLTIRLFNKELQPVYDASADISVEILDPDNEILRPHAEDYTDKDGTYRVSIQAPQPGKYKAHVIVNGECISKAGYIFRATGQYNYNKRKHSFRSSPTFNSGPIPSRSLSRMTTGHLTSMNSPRLSSLMSSRTAKSDGGLYSNAIRTPRGYSQTKPPSRLSVLVDESFSEDQSFEDHRKLENDFREPVTARKLLYNDVNCIHIAFDAALSHPSIEVSRDSLVIGLKANKTIFGSSPGESSTRRLRLYPGTIGTRSFRRAGLFYWELTIKYKILTLVRRTVLFEFGLARYDVIDSNFRNDRNPYSWVISGSGCHLCGRVCLHGWHNGQMISHFPFADRIPSPLRNYSTQEFGCLLDTSKRNWIIIDLKTRKIVGNFRNLVVSGDSEPLWPIFALYNPQQAHISMEIRYGSDVTCIPEEALDVLSI